MISERGVEPGTIIYGNYVVEGILGEGGFGITYLAARQDTGEKVAVKEYFPSQSAVREKDSFVIVTADGEEEEYDRGMARFIREASILMEFRYLPGIVKVWDCFEANNTAYIVMDYIDGITLKEYISCHGGMMYQELIKMLSPILNSLVTLHKHGIIHRDISPDNFMIGMDNNLYLIDFGAAKEIKSGKSTTVLWKEGYAPPEQYLRDGELGAWTDVYALCATIYTALCGKVPTDVVARLQGKELVPLSKQGVTLEKWQWSAISKGMSMRVAERFRDMGQLYDALTVEPTTEDIQTILGQEIEPQLQDKLQGLSEAGENLPVRRGNRFVRFGVVVLFACLIGTGFYFGSGRWTEGRTERRGQNTSLEDGKAALEENTSDVVNKGKTTTEEIQPRICQMPDVAGMDEKAARAKITDVDKVIQVRITREYSNDVERNVVIGQDVEPGTRYNEGAIKEIMLTVSDGLEPVTTSVTETSVTKTPATNAPAGKTEHGQDFYNVNTAGDETADFYLGD